MKLNEEASGNWALLKVLKLKILDKTYFKHFLLVQQVILV